jgi:hypothetical protein
MHMMKSPMCTFAPTLPCSCTRGRCRLWHIQVIHSVHSRHEGRVHANEICLHAAPACCTSCCATPSSCVLTRRHDRLPLFHSVIQFHTLVFSVVPATLSCVCWHVATTNCMSSARLWPQNAVAMHHTCGHDCGALTQPSSGGHTHTHTHTRTHTHTHTHTRTHARTHTHTHTHGLCLSLLGHNFTFSHTHQRCVANSVASFVRATGIVHYYTDEKQSQEVGKITVPGIVEILRPTPTHLKLITADKT